MGVVVQAPVAALVLSLDGFEGPLDVLLELARRQKVDLTTLPILPLAEQYLAFVQAARDRHLELAAEYLVMAAWLTYLKSRLLLPEPEEEAPDPDAMAAALALRLRRLDAMQKAAGDLAARDRLGDRRLVRGAPDGLTVRVEHSYRSDLGGLLRAYATVLARKPAARLAMKPPVLFSVDRALEHIVRHLGGPDWRDLVALVPATRGDTDRRSALASSLVASLELAKDGRLELRQDRPFGPVMVRAR
ncbi:segregation and condensation protein A [Marinivivus vitaminiproducens]|uniref:segregation and condensation protein A n=1 Tax=Marinivivus vitaminiproducens TaxID=3035935 RepID=UPI0027AB5D47|nr:ScpA family protein [Geminicoccaceae bacterium SCSIO 64248]